MNTANTGLWLVAAAARAVARSACHGASALAVAAWTPRLNKQITRDAACRHPRRDRRIVAPSIALVPLSRGSDRMPAPVRAGRWPRPADRENPAFGIGRAGCRNRIKKAAPPASVGRSGLPSPHLSHSARRCGAANELSEQQFPAICRSAAPVPLLDRTGGPADTSRVVVTAIPERARCLPEACRRASSHQLGTGRGQG